MEAHGVRRMNVGYGGFVGYRLSSSTRLFLLVFCNFPTFLFSDQVSIFMWNLTRLSEVPRVH